MGVSLTRRLLCTRIEKEVLEVRVVMGSYARLVGVISLVASQSLRSAFLREMVELAIQTERDLHIADNLLCYVPKKTSDSIM